MYYLNKYVQKLNRIYDQNERKDYLRLDLNENPKGLDDNILSSILNDITPRLISQYPETVKFTQTLAAYHNIDLENICLTNGSAEAIRYIIEAFTSENGKIIGVTPSYFMFQIYSEMYGRNFIPIKYEDDLTINVNNILDNLNDDIQMLILVNPNNPLGNIYSEEDFNLILKKCLEKKITLLIDEAYHYFYKNSFMDYAIHNRRVFVTRTFSKLFSMAGCRLGYVCGHPEDIKYIQKLCTPHNVNAMAMLFAEKIISSPEIVDNLINQYNEGRKFLIKELKKYNYNYHGDYGNFIFIKPKNEADKIVSLMKNDKKILIKKYEKIGTLGECLRVTIGDKECMRVFMEALTELDKLQ